MKKVGMVFFFFSLMVTGAFAGPKEFDLEKSKDAEKFAKDFLKTDMKKIKKLGIKKLVILECYGEYVTSVEMTNSASDQRYSGWVKSSTSTIELDKDFYTNTSNRVYAAVKKAFEDNGIQIVTPEEIQNSESYKAFNLEEEKEGRGASAGMFSPTKVEKSTNVSSNGLGIFPSNPLKMIKLVMSLGKITSELGAEGFLQIHFKVNKGKKAKPVLDALDIKLSADMKESKVGFGGKETRYDFGLQWLPIVTLNKSLISPDDVMDDKKELDVTKYDKALMDILNASAEGVKASLKKTLE